LKFFPSTLPELSDVLGPVFLANMLSLFAGVIPCTCSLCHDAS